MSEPGQREGLIRGLGNDLARLFPSDGSESSASMLIAAATLLQIAYWHFGAPALATPRQPASALASVLWAVVLLGLIPLLLARILRLDLRRMGLRLGDRSQGVRASLLGLLLVVPLAYFAAGDPSIRSSYPWPGSWAGSGWVAFLSWAGVYALYYLSYEFFFRGFLLRGLEPALGRFGALWLQAVASTLLHLGKPLVEVLAALPAGLIFGLLALRTRSLLYVVLIHLALGVSTDLFVLLR